MNLIGERQGGEKFLPTLIRKIAAGETVTVHGAPGNIGTRHYLHARNLADALVFILRNLPPAMFPAHAGSALEGAEAGGVSVCWDAPTADRPDRYNIVGPDRLSNLQLAQMVADITGQPLDYRLEDFHRTRPGHDPHYGLDGSKLKVLGWKPPVPFAESLAKTVRWSLANQEWLED
jgi:dTDP-glucose 4,6-dehydratase